MLEKILESHLDCKEIQPVHPEGNQFWIFIGRTDVEAETPILWPPDVKSWLIWKDPDAGKDWSLEEKGWQRMRWLDGITDQWAWVNSGSCWWTGRPGALQSMGSQRVGHDWATELNWMRPIYVIKGLENSIKIQKSEKRKCKREKQDMFKPGTSLSNEQEF